MKPHLQIDPAVVREQACADLAHRAAPGTWFHLVVVLMVAASTNYTSEHPAVIYSLFAVQAALSASRLCLFRRRTVAPERLRVPLCIIIALTGLTWGLFGAATTYVYPGSPVETLLVTICVMGVSISGLPVLASELTTLRLFVAATVGPTIIANALIWDRTHLGMSA